jgi:hypothetical protein
MGNPDSCAAANPGINPAVINAVFSSRFFITGVLILTLLPRLGEIWQEYNSVSIENYA